MDQTNMIDRGALFADETPQFRFPFDIEAGDEVTFRFRTRKDNAKRVVLLSRAGRYPMEKTETKGCFDYYETRLRVGSELFYYRFEISTDEDRCFFNRFGVTQAVQLNPEQAFRVVPGFHTPDWAKGAVMYQIFVDRFCNGDPSNDVLTNEYAYVEKPVEHVDWDSPLEPVDVRRFYGGDLQGVRDKLDYLKRLGVEVIYFNPLFVSPSNHKYDIQDYDHIDPHFTGFVHDTGELLPEGSLTNRLSERYVTRVTDPENLEHANAYFAELVQEIHKRGMKVILDGVFNHCGSFNKWMDSERIYEGKPGYAPGAAILKESPYHRYFQFTEDSKWPENAEYLGWWNYETLPKLNYENSQELHDYVLRIAKKWLAAPYNIDGWRLDVASDLGASNTYNHRFWRDFREAVKEENPEALIVAEHYGSPEHWLRGDQWDTVMNYDAFMEPVGYFLTGMEKHSDEYVGYLHGNGRAFFQMMYERMSRLPVQSLYTAMNELSNHDHARFLTRTNRTVGRLETRGAAAASEGISYATFREGVVMQFTLPGAPTIYYGDETGMCGWTDPDSRRPFPWGHETWDLITFHRDVIRIHKRYSSLRTGSYKPLQDGYGYIAYGRFDESNAVLVVVNHAMEAREIEVPVWQIRMPLNGTLYRILQTNDVSYNVGIAKAEVRDGVLKTTVPAWSATLYAYNGGPDT